MLNVVRRSQIIGWIAIDSSTANSLGELEEVWLDNSGRIAYFSGGETYLPVLGIAGVGMGAVSVYYPPLEDTPDNLRRLHEITVESTLGENLGWVEDFYLIGKQEKSQLTLWREKLLLLLVDAQCCIPKMLRKLPSIKSLSAKMLNINLRLSQRD